MPNNSIFLIGCGGHGKVVLDTLLQTNHTIDGIIDNNLPVGSQVFGVPVVGDDTFIESLPSSRTYLVNGLGHIGKSSRRNEIFDHWMGQGHNFLGFHHPSAIVGRGVEIASSVQLMAGVIVQSGTRLGPNVLLNSGAIVEHDSILEQHVFVAPHATVCGAVRIGKGSFIGAGAVIFQGVEIGEMATIGAGAVVRTNVKPGTKMVGSLAKEIE